MTYQMTIPYVETTTHRALWVCVIVLLKIVEGESGAIDVDEAIDQAHDLLNKAELELFPDDDLEWPAPEPEPALAIPDVPQDEIPF